MTTCIIVMKMLLVDT